MFVSVIVSLFDLTNKIGCWIWNSQRPLIGWIISTTFCSWPKMSHTQQQWKVYESKALVSFAFRARHSTWHRVQRNWGCIALERSHFFINCVPKIPGSSNAIAQYWKIQSKCIMSFWNNCRFFYLSKFLLKLYLLFSIAYLKRFLIWLSWDTKISEQGSRNEW